jgi:hypothetical protein
MKKLNEDKLSMINGGSVESTISGICGAVAVYGIWAVLVSAAIPGIGQVAIGFCAAWTIGNGLIND